MVGLHPSEGYDVILIVGSARELPAGNVHAQVFAPSSFTFHAVRVDERAGIEVEKDVAGGGVGGSVDHLCVAVKDGQCNRTGLAKRLSDFVLPVHQLVESHRAAVAQASTGESYVARDTPRLAVLVHLVVI